MSELESARKGHPRKERVAGEMEGVKGAPRVSRLHTREQTHGTEGLCMQGCVCVCVFIRENDRERDREKERLGRQPEGN